MFFCSNLVRVICDYDNATDLATLECPSMCPHLHITEATRTLRAMFASRGPLLPSFLSFVTVTKELRYFNVLIFSCRCQAHIANQMVSIFHKWSRVDITSDASRLSKGFHREFSIILSHVSVTSNDR